MLTASRLFWWLSCQRLLVLARETYGKLLSCSLALILCMSDEPAMQKSNSSRPRKTLNSLKLLWERGRNSYFASLGMHVLHSALLLILLWVSLSLPHTQEFFLDWDLMITVKTQYYGLSLKWLWKINTSKFGLQMVVILIKILTSMDQFTDKFILNACLKEVGCWGWALKSRSCPWPLTLTSLSHVCTQEDTLLHHKLPAVIFSLATLAQRP